MTDTFMSGWGKAAGKINKLVIECDTLEEAEIVAENARNRTDQKHINICSKKPSYGSRYYVSWKDKSSYPKWFERGFFRSAQ